MTEKWSITGSRVHGYGKSFNLTNKITAEQLYHILTNYEKQQQNNTNQEQIQSYLIKILMDLSILQSDINELKEALK